MSSPTVVIFQPSKCLGGIIMAKLVLPQALGNAAAMYVFSSSGDSTPRISMCSASQPWSRAMHDAIRRREALLAQQRIAAVTAAERPDRPFLGEVDDVLVLGVAGPGHVLLTGRERHPHGVHAGDEEAVAQRVEDRGCPCGS